MQFILRSILFVTLLIFIGCGSGGGSSKKEDTSSARETTKEVYQNSNLPKINNRVIPEVLLDKNRNESQKLVLSKKEKSQAFLDLRKRVGYFYFRQMNMNMELSYLDSVWGQVESYCKGETVCTIPENNITFTYTEALYNHDIELITLYEKKSLDTSSFKNLKEQLKNQIGLQALLGAVTLTTLSNSSFDYELKADVSNITFDDDNLTTITHWNREKTLYSMREELHNGYNGDSGICRNSTESLIYTGFDYNKTVDRVENSFKYGYDVDCLSTTSTFEGEVEDNYIQKHNLLFKLLELPSKIRLTEHISDRIINNNYNTPMDFYSEGEIDEEGGFLIVSDSQGYYVHETFDSEGNIIKEIKCMGDESRDLDDCTIKGEDAIKAIVLKSVYKIGLYEPLDNVIARYSAVTFEENNTLSALVNCSRFEADYNLDNRGITFSNIVKTNDPLLVCLDNSFAEGFRSFLERGYEFNSEGYIVWNGLSADLDVLEEKSKFDKDKFLLEMKKDRYVDSYTMNNLFKVDSLGLGGFENPSENRTYFLSQNPTMKIENDKIYFDLIDFTFEADIHVIDNDTIKFSDIVKKEKSNVVYPARECTNEPGENECLDGDANLVYEDKTFSNVIETFLNSTVEVGNGGVADNGILWFHNKTLSFEGLYE